MQSNWTLKENSTGELLVTVDGQDWANAQKKALANAKRNINIKGFRKGQVPDSIVRKYYGKMALQSLAAEQVANEALAFGIDENGLKLVDRPVFDIKESNEESAVLVFTCVVSPEVELGEYKGLEVAKDVVEVTDEEVEETLKSVQNRFADWLIRDEAETAEDGDKVTIDFIGTKDGIPFDGGSGTDYPLELGSNTFIPGFEEQLVGVKVGEEKDVVVTFPEDYQSEELAGQEATFKVTVHEISYKELPEVNDELIKQLKLENIETVDAYKEDQKAKLLARKQSDADVKFETEVLDAVMNNSKVEIPEIMVTDEVDRLYNNYSSQMSGQGFTFDQYLQAVGQTVEDFKAQMRPDAQRNVFVSLVLDAIAKKENLEVTEDEVNAEYESLSTQYGMPVDQIKSIISTGAIKDEVVSRKALDLIKTSVK